MTTERISGFRITDEALSDSRRYFFYPPGKWFVIEISKEHKVIVH